MVSNNNANTHLDRFQVVPLTTQTERVYPGEVVVQVLDQPSKVMTNQIITTSINRFGKKHVTLSSIDMQAVDQALQMQLGLD